MNNESKIRSILFNYMYFEFGEDLSFKDNIDEFLTLFNGRIFPIAESNFATTIEFYCKTVFDIDDLTLKNSVINCNTDKEINSKVSFENPSELEFYLNNSCFDELLLLDLDELTIESKTQ